LTVTDDEGDSADDTVDIEITPFTSMAPLADAGSDLTVNDSDNDGSQAVALDGSGSTDPDGGSLVSYEWHEGGVLLADGMNPTVSLAVGLHTLTLTVTDDEGDSADDTVDIEITPFTSMAPLADAGSDLTVNDSDNDGSQAVALDGSGSTDPDGGSLVSYEWYESDVLLAEGMNPTVSLAVGLHTLTLTVTDDEGDSADDTVTISVEDLPEFQTLTVTPIDDAYLQDAAGIDDDRVRVQHDRRTGYLKFDVTAVGSGVVTRAVLRLRVRGDAGNGTVRAYLGEHNNWNEDNLGVSTRPAPDQALGAVTSRFGLDQYIEIDVGSGINSAGIYSLILTMDAGGNDVAFGSKEAPGFEPQLSVEFSH
jgi:hypothetical protein